MAAHVPIAYRILALEQERNRLLGYPIGSLADLVRATGFGCIRCGSCCTRAVGGHVFLLDRDIPRISRIDPSALEPAPDPEFCDQDGTLYVSGYAVRTKGDPAGSCWFLDGRMCRIYDERFSACRIYPHMLRRSSDKTGRVAWRTFARPYRHGRHDREIPADEALAVAGGIREYESAFLNQQIAFLETVADHFSLHALYHDDGNRARQIHRFSLGDLVCFRVFHAGELEEHRISKAGRAGP